MFGRYWEDKQKSRLLFTQFPVHVTIGEPQQKSSWDFVSGSLRFTPPPQYIGTYLDVDQIFSLGFCLFSVSLVNLNIQKVIRRPMLLTSHFLTRKWIKVDKGGLML